MFVRATVKSDIAAGGKVMSPKLAGKWISPMHPRVIKDEPGTCDVCGMPLVPAEELGYATPDTSKQDRPLVIPASTALLTGTRAIVYVKLPDTEKPTFEGREVLLGPKAGDFYIVKRGLKAGEEVVTQGSFKLDAELQINAKPSMMTPGTDAPSAGDGHAHHQPETAKSESEADKDSVNDAAADSIPTLVEEDIRTVLNNAAVISELDTRTKDLEELREAFKALLDSVEAVDAGPLSGDAAIAWKEYKMLLGNDAAEGSELADTEQFESLATETMQHANALKKALRISPKVSKDTKETPLAPEFTTALQQLITGYLAIQTALAHDNLDKAQKATNRSQESLKDIDMTLLKGQRHQDWMKHTKALKKHLESIKNATDLETARKQFQVLSNVMLMVIQDFGPPEGKLYKAWCPMAFGNTGAAWLQNQEDIANPYFGEMMFGCGEIQEVYK
jgi:Cu(I)/Ag(I) efflux system membrane fusion protein